MALQQVLCLSAAQPGPPQLLRHSAACAALMVEE